MKAQRIRTVLRGFILIHLLALNVRAQVYETYNLNWFTLDGGGGSSAGGNFS